jgi:hypothetical protein
LRRDRLNHVGGRHPFRVSVSMINHDSEQLIIVEAEDELMDQF